MCYKEFVDTYIKDKATAHLSEIANVLIKLGQAHHNKKKYKEAQEYYEKCLEIKRKI